MPNSRFTFENDQHQRRLTRLRMLGLTSSNHHSFSLPDSTETPHAQPCSHDHLSSSAVPRPLPLPELFINRKSKLPGSCPASSQLASLDHRIASSGTRKNADHAAKSLVNLRKGLYEDEPIEIPKPRFATTPASPQRSSNQYHFYSYDVADSAKSLLSRCGGFSPENYGRVNHNLRLDVHHRSAPTTAFSSPAVSPRRSKTVDLFPSNHMEWFEDNLQVNAYPLPLPPGALLSSQSPLTLPSPVLNRLIEKPTTTSMMNQWQKGRLLGRGTYGSVYEATNRETGALCSIKEVDIIPDDPKSFECIKQLEQEISVLRHLNHPNIVQYYGSEIVDDHFYIYLEYVHPGSINRYVREHCRSITESIVRNFTRHILSGLAYLHSSKTVHRDIKGANLLVDANGVVKLADFGMAKHLTGLSYDLSLKGSPYWMAPEVIKAVMQQNSSPNVALAADIWSLGCTIIEMLNGKPPWSELEGPQAMFKVLNKTPPLPEALSPEGKDFLCCCFRRNPAERPPAAILLEHPFIRNSADQSGSILMQVYSRLNLRDNSNSPRNFPTHKTEVKATSPGTRITKGKSACNSDTDQLGYVKTMNCAVASHHPFFSTLEVSNHTAATGLVSSSHSFSPSSDVPGNMKHGAVNNHPCAVGRTEGKEVRHI
ncbi:hypothetical protein V6N11_031015 [Hibiscus sabdariffa]|uniref:Protein kinase domain-containing protein n=1 Tax=Hibiscus sabdariffa TaxID=183260 RepID=A0ABR2A430_9ROSI